MYNCTDCTADQETIEKAKAAQAKLLKEREALQQLPEHWSKDPGTLVELAANDVQVRPSSLRGHPFDTGCSP